MKRTPLSGNAILEDLNESDDDMIDVMKEAAPPGEGPIQKEFQESQVS